MEQFSIDPCLYYYFLCGKGPLSNSVWHLVVGPLTAWVRVSLSPGNFQTWVLSNLIVGRVSMAGSYFLTILSRFFPHCLAPKWAY